MTENSVSREIALTKAKRQLLSHTSHQLLFLGEVEHPSRLDLPDFVQRIVHRVLVKVREDYPTGFGPNPPHTVYRPYLNMAARLFDDELADSFQLDRSA